MVLPPYVYRGDWRESKAHFQAVLGATELSCMLYNNPIAYGTDVSPEEMLELVRFENLHAADHWWAGWLKLFGELVEMLRRSEAGEPAEDFNPHMRAVIPPSGRQMGPGWDEAVPS